MTDNKENYEQLDTDNKNEDIKKKQKILKGFTK